MESHSFCDFSDSSEGSLPSTATILNGPLPPHLQPLQPTFRGPRSPLPGGPQPPRLDVDWSDSPPLSLSLRFSGIFTEEELEAADTTRRTHESQSVSLDMSYDIQTFPNLKDVVPDFGNDSDITEVLFMTPKLPGTLSTIPEAVEPSPVLTYNTTLSDFDILTIGNTTDSGISTMLCKRRKTGMMYKIRCRRDRYPWTEQDILETLRDLGAPFLPHLRSSFREDGRVHLVLDHLPAGNLRELVDRTGALTSQRIMFYASEIIVGLANLHSIGIMHRNLNPDDVMFDLSGHIVISNFEFADFVASSGQNSTSFGFISGDFMNNQPKTKCYQAPEILLGWAHDSVVDCWGFGMVLYYMYFGKHPFKIGVGPEGEEDLKARVIEGTLSPDSLRLIHPQTRELILKCIERNPRVRLTLDDIKRHGFFTNVSWTKVADRMVEVPPFPGSYQIQTTREAAPPNRYSSVTSSSSSQPQQHATPPSEVQPLRIEKKSSKSPLLPSRSSNAGTPAEPIITEGTAHGVSSPKNRTFRALPRSTEARHQAQGPSLSAAASRESVAERQHQLDSPRARGGLGGGPPGVEIWDILDQEEQERAMSLRSSTTEVGKRGTLFSFFKGKVGGKARGTGSGIAHNNNQNNRASFVYPKNLFMNLSTVSFGRKKSKASLSISSLASCKSPDTVPPVPRIPTHYGGIQIASSTRVDSVIDELPSGLEQIGSGIGFKYNLHEPARSASKLSLCSGTPRGCYNAFVSARASAVVPLSKQYQMHEMAGPGAAGSGLGLGAEYGNGYVSVDAGRGLGVNGRHQDGESGVSVEKEKEVKRHASDTYHIGNSATWIVPCVDGGAPGVSRSPAVQAYLGGHAAASPTSPVSSASSPQTVSSPASQPYTPTAVACEGEGDELSHGADDGKDYGMRCSVGTLESRMEPDLTLRLVSQAHAY
ncbi:hypothetical protein D9611_009913 [Ephemerocybe angulata]|uniref:Protein kinase domain-containing protein n=1 Tax=Ephemerocybe angulata TaxID=980116 RepID=A0A8H5CCQ3_9AGAR|nr:hypothetical protein D9611_009913 [Tulosesus angulatus]